jgi:protease-4
MSPEARKVRLEWLSQLWQAYEADVAEARGLSVEALQEYVELFPEKLARHGGSAAELALAEGLVDQVGDRESVRRRLIELVGEDEESGSYRAIGAAGYLTAVGARPQHGDGTVAIVVARGPIVSGVQPPGMVGGDSAARLIRRARQDDKVKALVLRVDSPGGSAFASELIRREVELTQEAGKPVIASMGSVAASGGYWISMSADEIWAYPTTITGSIGIFGMVPTFQKTLAKVGIHNDGVGTTWAAGTLRPERELPQQAADSLRLMIDQGYEEFITGVAAGRKMTREEVDGIGRGHVWSGADAAERGLVDHLGGLEDAIAAAARRAGLAEEYRVRYLEDKPSFTDQLLADLLARGVSALRPAADSLTPPRPRALELLDRLAAEVDTVTGLSDPRGLYAYCFCEVE